MKSNSNINRIWSEQDFSEFYEEYPKIVNSCTYSRVQLLVGSEHVLVKVPTDCSEQTYRFLLYRALYFHHLNKKTQNPLFQTARVSFFEQVDGFMGWYGLWASGKALNKNSLLRCVNYQNEESIKRYKPLALMQQKNGFAKILARSCKDSKYYNISIYSNSRTSENGENLLQENFKSLQHPFISHLCQYHRNSRFSYFIFEHHPHAISQILENQNMRLTKKQAYLCYIQFLLALAFLEQQPILNWDISMETIRVSTDGHMALTESVVENKDNKKHKTDIAVELFQKLLSCLNPNENLNVTEKQMSFRQQVQLGSKKKWCSKQLLGHPWIREHNVQSIIGKNTPALNPALLNSNSNQNFHQLNKEHIDKYFQAPYEQYPYGYLFQSYKINPQSSNEAIIRKYSPSVKIRQNQYAKRLKKTTSSLSLQKKENKVLFYPKLAWNEEQGNHSPYEAVLKKESKVRKRYLQQ